MATGTLTSTTIANRYKSLLKLTGTANDVLAADGSAKYIEDGDGNDSILSLSTNRIGIATNSPAVDLDIRVPINIGVNGTGQDVKFFGDTSGVNMLWDQSADALVFTDSAKIIFGAGSDIEIYHDGSNSYIENKTGELRLATAATGIAVSIGHTTSETTVNDNLTVTGTTTLDTTTIQGILTTTNPAVFNEGGVSHDFRVESLNFQHILFVDGSADKIGINTSSPDTLVDIESTATNAANRGAVLRLGSNDGTVMVSTDRLGALEFAGAEDTSSTMTVGAKIEAVADNTWSASENGAALDFYTTDGNAVETKRFIINATGQIYMTAYADGDVTFTGSGAGLVTTSSDERMKEDINTLELDGIAKVNALNPVTFKWREKSLIDGSDVPQYDPDAPNSGIQMGFIAQEAAEIIPQVSPDHGDDRQRGMYSGPIIAVLVKAVQELSVKITALEGEDSSSDTKIAALETKDAEYATIITALTDRITALEGA